MKPKIQMYTALCIFLVGMPALASSQQDSMFLRTFAPVAVPTGSKYEVVRRRDAAEHLEDMTHIESLNPGETTAKRTEPSPPRLFGTISVDEKLEMPALVQTPVILDLHESANTPQTSILTAEKDTTTTTTGDPSGHNGTVSATEKDLTFKAPKDPLEAPANTYYMALSFNLTRDVKFDRVTARLLNPPDDLKIVSIFPTHEYLSSQYEHTNEFGVSGTGGFAPYGSVTVHDTDTRKTSYGVNRPLVYGLVDETDQMAQWNFLRQGQQHIDPGLFTVFVAISSATNLANSSDLQVMVSEFTTKDLKKPPKAFAIKTCRTSTVKGYRFIHKSELPASRVAFLNTLANDEAAAPAATYKLTISPAK